MSEIFEPAKNGANEEANREESLQERATRGNGVAYEIPEEMSVVTANDADASMALFQDYLDGQGIAAPLYPKQAPIEGRITNFLKNNFAQIDKDNNGEITGQEFASISMHPEDSSDPKAVVELDDHFLEIARFSGDEGTISRLDVSKLEQKGVVLRENSRVEDSARKLTDGDKQNTRLVEDYVNSQLSGLSSSELVKAQAMVHALAQADTKAFDALTKACKNNPKELEKISNAIDSALAVTDIGLKFKQVGDDSRIVLMTGRGDAMSFSTMVFSTKEQPVASMAMISPDAAMEVKAHSFRRAADNVEKILQKEDRKEQIGENRGPVAEVMQQNTDFIDRLVKERYIKDLNASEKELVEHLLDAARAPFVDSKDRGNEFIETMEGMAALTPQRMNKVAEALDEILLASNTDVTSLATKDARYLQFRSMHGDKAITYKFGIADNTAKYLGAETGELGQNSGRIADYQAWLCNQFDRASDWGKPQAMKGAVEGMMDRIVQDAASQAIKRQAQLRNGSGSDQDQQREYRREQERERRNGKGLF